jgi:lysozyme family protein
MMFNVVVNMGLATAMRHLQKSLNVYGAGLCVDSAFGANTTLAVNSLDPELVLDLLCGVSREHYEGIAAARPSSKNF